MSWTGLQAIFWRGVHWGAKTLGRGAVGLANLADRQLVRLGAWPPAGAPTDAISTPVGRLPTDVDAAGDAP